jgi:hypothetical protein
MVAPGGIGRVTARALKKAFEVLLQCNDPTINTANDKASSNTSNHDNKPVIEPLNYRIPNLTVLAFNVHQTTKHWIDFI